MTPPLQTSFGHSPDTRDKYTFGSYYRKLRYNPDKSQWYIVYSHHYDLQEEPPYAPTKEDMAHVQSTLEFYRTQKVPNFISIASNESSGGLVQFSVPYQLSYSMPSSTSKPPYHRPFPPALAIAVVLQISELFTALRSNAPNKQQALRYSIPSEILLNTRGEIQLLPPTDCIELTLLNLSEEPVTITTTQGWSHLYDSSSLQGEEPTHSNINVYHLGVLLYQGLTGRMPKHAQKHGKLIPPSKCVDGVPAFLDRLVMKALGREKSSFSSVQAFADALRPFIQEKHCQPYRQSEWIERIRSLLAQGFPITPDFAECLQQARQDPVIENYLWAHIGPGLLEELQQHKTVNFRSFLSNATAEEADSWEDCLVEPFPSWKTLYLLSQLPSSHGPLQELLEKGCLSEDMHLFAELILGKESFASTAHWEQQLLHSWHQTNPFREERASPYDFSNFDWSEQSIKWELQADFVSEQAAGIPKSNTNQAEQKDHVSERIDLRQKRSGWRRFLPKIFAR